MIKRLRQRIRKKKNKNTDMILGVASLLFMLILILVNQVDSLLKRAKN